MILTVIILAILIAAGLRGYRQGFVALMLSLVIYFAAWLMASWGANGFGSFLMQIFPQIGSNNAQTTLTSNLTLATNQLFYHGIAFLILFLIVNALGRWLIRRFHWVNRIPLIGWANQWAGGIVNLVIAYLIIFILLVIFQVLPIEVWQNQLTASGLAQWIIHQTPFLTQWFFNWIL